MKVLIVGLPLFAKRLTDDLSDFDKANTYKHLNTYYSQLDKFRALLLIPKVNLVFSINGTLTDSKVFDLALKSGTPIIMNWVGTDVLKAIKAFQNNDYREDYLQRAIHFCEVDWIKDELKEIGIDAEICNFASFDKTFEIQYTGNQRLKVLSYISENRAEFYGMSEFLRLARNFPMVDFVIAGTKGDEYKPLPENVQALGWVDNMDELFGTVDVCLRYPEHDGLSTFILEALARGKQVLYKYPFKHCIHCPSEKELNAELGNLLAKHEAGDRVLNRVGKMFIEENFSRKVILGNLVKKMYALSGK